MENLSYLKYDTNVFTPPFRLGRKQQRAVLDAKGKEVIIFPDNSAIQATLYVNYLNAETTITINDCTCFGRYTCDSCQEKKWYLKKPLLKT